MQTDPIADGHIMRLVESALMEDIGAGDVTSDATLDDDARAVGEFLCKGEGVIAGLEIADLVFRLCDDQSFFKPFVADGTRVRSGQVVAMVEGRAKDVLSGERVALNFLQRMSGIATMTRLFVDAVAGTRAKITDTRKTAPGLRALDKLAVRLGGGVNHRFGLDDMVLIKDNHIVASGGITAAVKRCQEYIEKRGLPLGIEVETGSLQEVHEALECQGIQRIMLDNFPVARMKEAVEIINGRVEVEASGGVTLETVRAIAESGVDFISVGALTHSAKTLDISLELIAGAHEPHA